MGGHVYDQTDWRGYLLPDQQLHTIAPILYECNLRCR